MKEMIKEEMLELIRITPGLVLFAMILMLPAILGWMGFGPWQ